MNFFEKLAGRWFSQRTTHYLESQTSQAGQSNLEIDYLAPDHSKITQLCEQAAPAGQTPLCGLQIHHDSRMDGDVDNVKTTSFMVVFTPQDNDQGMVLLQGNGWTQATTGHYVLEDEILTITTETDEGTTEERLWFVNPNLRMRTSVFSKGDDVQLTAFCSEIRMGVVPSPQ